MHKSIVNTSHKQTSSQTRNKSNNLNLSGLEMRGKDLFVGCNIKKWHTNESA